MHLIVVPDMGFPTHASYSDENTALRALKQAVMSAAQGCSLEGFAFYLLRGEAAQIYVNPRTLEVALKLGGKKRRLVVEDLDDMELLDGGHLPVREVSSPASGVDEWDAFGEANF